MIDDLLTKLLKSEDYDDDVKIEKVMETINKLIENGIVESITVNDETMYRLTETGKQVAKQLHRKGKQ